MLLHAFLATASSLLYNITQDPTSPFARSDLLLVKPFLRLLERVVDDPSACGRSDEVRQIQQFCNSLNDEAEKAIQIFSLDFNEPLV
jgi:hypothetical protein